MAFADAYTTLGMSPSGIDWMVTSGASFWRFWSKNTFPKTYPQTGAGREMRKRVHENDAIGYGDVVVCSNRHARPLCSSRSHVRCVLVCMSACACACACALLPVL